MWVSLMYHDVAAGDPGGGGGPERFTVSSASFEAMLDAIAEGGFTGCSLAEALGDDVGSPVAITFDDGTTGQFEQAAPALLERGMTATFFVVTDWVGRPGFMTWDQLRQLVEWGMSVQSHTRSHPHLSELDAEALRSELSESRLRLDEELAQHTDQIAQPGGNAPRPGLRHLLAECGYGVVATSRWGRNSHGVTSGRSGAVWLRRCTVPKSPSTELAQRIISGDSRLAVTRYSREAALNGIRAALGANRYARWRRRVLNVLDR